MSSTRGGIVLAIGILVFIAVYLWYFTQCASSPELAFVPGVLFLVFSPSVFGQRTPHSSLWGIVVLLVGSVWVVFGLWEMWMSSMVDPVDVPIRVDLVAWLPVLCIASLLGTYGALRRWITTT